MFARGFAVALLVAAVLVAAAACGDDPTPRRCTNIPAGGCPVADGVACQDPTCEAVYLCLPGNVWQLQGPCPAHEAGAPPVSDAAVDAPPGAYGGPGCADLQTPDCSLGVVLSCGGCCGCDDLFVCQDQGWTLWGSCSDAGVVQAH